MSAIKIDRGPDQNPWLIHANTVEEVDAHLRDTTHLNPEIANQLLDLRNRLRGLESRA